MIDDLAGRQRQAKRRDELHEAYQAQRQRAAGEIVDQPADRDRLHLVRGVGGGARREQKPERAMAKQRRRGMCGRWRIAHRAAVRAFRISMILSENR
ncbi:MAG TPA: hypothetical protein VMR17_22200 [Xanthobacteraceae bacterium]|nr:hypothetical protein [Xanthobacteraceae bacterium]